MEPKSFQTYSLNCNNPNNLFSKALQNPQNEYSWDFCCSHICISFYYHANTVLEIVHHLRDILCFTDILIGQLHSLRITLVESEALENISGWTLRMKSLPNHQSFSKILAMIFYQPVKVYHRTLHPLNNYQRHQMMEMQNRRICGQS